MQLVYGQTPCVLCGAKLYITDDPFVAEAWPGTEAIAGFRPGVYHYDCFQRLEYLDAYCLLKGAAQLRQLRAPAWRILGQDERVALAWNETLRESRVLFMRRARQLTLVGHAERQEFALLAASLDPQKPMTAAGSRFQLEPVGEKWLLSIREPVAGAIQLDPGDFDVLLRHLGLAREALAGRSIDLAELCQKLGIAAVASSFPPDHAYAQVAAIESAPASGPVTIRLTAWKSAQAHLSQADLRSLQGLFARSQAEAAW